MFWGVIVNPNKPVYQHVNEPLHLTMATLAHDAKNLPGKCKRVVLVLKYIKSDFILCSLEYDKIMNVPLNLVFHEGEGIEFYVLGNGIVHLTGYKMLPSINGLHTSVDHCSEVTSLTDGDAAKDEDDLDASESKKRKYLSGVPKQVKRAKKYMEVAKPEIERDGLSEHKEQTIDTEDVDHVPAESDEAVEENDDDESEEEPVSHDGSDANKFGFSENVKRNPTQKEHNLLTESYEDAAKNNDISKNLNISNMETSFKKPSIDMTSNSEKEELKQSCTDEGEPAPTKKRLKKIKKKLLKEKLLKSKNVSTTLSREKKEEKFSNLITKTDGERPSIKTIKELKETFESKQEIMDTKKKLKKLRNKARKKLKNITSSEKISIESPLSTAQEVKKEKGVPSDNIKICDIRIGNGPPARKGKFVHMCYIGYLSNGREFAAVRDRPFSFRLGNEETFSGLDAGVEGMRVGGKRKIIVSGSKRHESKRLDIPPNSTLIYEVELKAVS